GLVELKRMYVKPAERGNGFGKLILEALEEEARALGAARVVLENSVAQPESIGLYQRAGYEEIPCFGAYAGEPLSRCFERCLTSRSLCAPVTRSRLSSAGWSQPTPRRSAATWPPTATTSASICPGPRRRTRPRAPPSAAAGTSARRRAAW